MISLLVLTIVLLGAYKFMNRVSRVTAQTLKTTDKSRETTALQLKLNRMLRNLGFNPGVVPYVVDPADPLRWDKRIGVTMISAIELDYTSNDNVLQEGCTPSNSACKNDVVQDSEKYELWIASDPANPVSSKITGSGSGTFLAKLDQSADQLCTPVANEKFDQRYVLVGRTKASSTSMFADPTVPVILEDKVLCMEIRYFTRGDTANGEKPWERLWSGSTVGPPTYPYQPPIYANNGTPSEGDYFKFLRDRVQKIEIGLLLEVGTDQLKERDAANVNPLTGDFRKTDRLIFETKIANQPWLQSYTTGKLPGRG